MICMIINCIHFLVSGLIPEDVVIREDGDTLESVPRFARNRGVQTFRSVHYINVFVKKG